LKAVNGLIVKRHHLNATWPELNRRKIWRMNACCIWIASNRVSVWLLIKYLN
jgi:hypothetical protein